MSDFFYKILEKRYSRRNILKFFSAAVLITILPAKLMAETSLSPFEEVPHEMIEGLNIAKGYRADVLIGWGEKLFSEENFNLPQTRQEQEESFGYNNDFIAFMPLPLGSDNSENGILCVNHEFTNPELMFPNYQKMTKKIADITLAAHGHSLVEIGKENGAWKVKKGSKYNRRITGFTNFKMAGPAALSPRLATSYDKDFSRITGTLNNCSGGKTPWGTILICEENFDYYFSGETQGREAENQKRYFSANRKYPLHKFYDRFDLTKEPNEQNRLGWVVEIDPYDPAKTPVKRTALGRFKHEAATTALCADGRVAVYSGDDQQLEYIYKFISKNKFDENARANNFNLLDEGTLYVARFHETGEMQWLPLIFGENDLDERNGFYSQADILIEARKAGDIVGATKMDRPEDIETNPQNGSVFIVLTNNIKRIKTDEANPRMVNNHGHIIEMMPPQVNNVSDHGALQYDWQIFLKAGNPANIIDAAEYHKDVSSNGWLSCPDNIAFDKKGRMWIATDGQDKIGFSDAVYMTETEGKNKALTRHFLNAPRGAEVCGPEFTPDGKTFFISIQHPGEEGGSTFENPVTRWPDFDEKIPPRPSVVAITKDDEGEIGG